jgi:phage internal scaffolding protein
MPDMKIRKFGDRPRVKQEIGEEESMVQQHLAEETDINVIMKRYQRTGELRHVTPMAGEYGDFSDVPDYKSAMERIMAADALFMELPAAVRDRFGNDPAQFIEFATDKSNLDELRKLGLAPEAPGAPEPQLVKVVQEPDGPDPKKPGKGDQ